MRGFFAAALLLAGTAAEAGKVETQAYGKLKDGRAVEQVTLTNDSGMTVKLISYGAIITDIVVPDRAGKPANVALSFGNLADYEAKNQNYGMGAVIGRYAGRIAGATFSIDGKPVKLNVNDGENALHGGSEGFDRRIWAVRTFEEPEAVGAELRYTSPAGEQNFPGALAVKVTYRLTDRNELRVDYEAETDAPTVFNLTNHSYFNMAGAGSGSVLGQRLQVFADKMVGASAAGIPNGSFPAVAGTPFDFRQPAALGARMKDPAVGERGYNHSWMLPDQRGDVVKLAARISDPASGRRMDVLTSEPTIHAYVAGYFSGEDKGAEGKLYRAFDGVALETQHLSDSPNRPAFPSTLLRPGDLYRSTTIFRFGTE